MNCQECREDLAAYVEGLLDAARRSRIDAHLAECPDCRAELRETRGLADLLTRDGLAGPPVSLEAAVMDRILHQQAVELRRLKMKKRIRLWGISGAMATAVLILIASGFWFTQPAEAQSQKAAEVLARGAEAVPNLATVHITIKMRRYFPHIFPEADFVRAEVWRQFGNKPKWRVEEPEEIVVMDGTSAVGLFRNPEDPEDIPRAEKIPGVTWGPWDTYPLLDLANVRDAITDELRSALANRWNLKLAHETTPAGEKKYIVTVEAKAGLPSGDYLKDKFWDLSDMRREYRFDAKTQRLEGFKAYLHQSGGDVLIISADCFEYGRPIDPAVFSLKLPANVFWVTDPKPLPDNEKYEKMTPKEAARAFFEGCTKEDWDETLKFSTTPWSKSTKEYYGGLKIIRIGEPFQSARDVGKDVDWFVPYEVKLKSGKVCKHNLALRKCESARRYIVDGGTP